MRVYFFKQQRQYLWMFYRLFKKNCSKPVVLISIFIFMAIYVISEDDTSQGITYVKPKGQPDIGPKKTEVQVATGLCGNEGAAMMGVAMVKSMLILGNRPIMLHIFTDEHTRHILQSALSSLAEITTWRVFNFKLYDIAFPDSKWYKLYKACSCQRLFYGSALPDIDSVVHIDADSVLFRPVEDLWDQLNLFNDIQIMAAAKEAEHQYKNYGPQYRHRPNFPIFPPFGLQAGIVLINLTRMREVKWEEQMTPILDEFGIKKLQLGDQDVINVYFNRQPDRLFVLGCEWNWRFTHCMKFMTCPNAEERGIGLLHGAGNTFGRTGGILQPAIAWEILTAPYLAIKNYPFGEPTKISYFPQMRAKIEQLMIKDNSSPCAGVILSSIKQIENGNSVKV